MRVHLLIILLTSGLVGCGETTAPELSPVVGEWSTPPVVSRFDGSISSTSLSLRGDGTYVRSWHMQDSPGAERAYSTSEGTFTVRGDSIFMRVALLRNWDRDFNGGVVTVTPVATTSASSGARFEQQGDNLILHYLTYPADAPIETVEEFVRIWLIL